MKENNEVVTMDLDIEVLDRREELLVAAAGTCTTTTGPVPVAIPVSADQAG